MSRDRIRTVVGVAEIVDDFNPVEPESLFLLRTTILTAHVRYSLNPIGVKIACIQVLRTTKRAMIDIALDRFQ